MNQSFVSYRTDCSVRTASSTVEMQPFAGLMRLQPKTLVWDITEMSGLQLIMTISALQRLSQCYSWRRPESADREPPLHQLNFAGTGEIQGGGGWGWARSGWARRQPGSGRGLLSGLIPGPRWEATWP